jgi:tRNA A37 threonylcarbamoyladenosine modification protein TsaB
MDAHRRDVFSALYRVGRADPFESERLIELDPPSVDVPAATLQRWTESGHVPSHIVGDGAVKYGEGLKDRVHIVPPAPLAGVIGRIAYRSARNGASVDPAALHPLYIRRPDAEIARDARTQGDR